MLFINFGCNTKKDLSTNTYSNKFNNKSDKIDFMEKYYTPNFDYLDVEYHIVYHDNESGRGTPGPSDWYMQFAFKMESVELAKISKQKPSNSFDLSQRINFLPINETWNIDFPKTYFENGDVIIGENNLLLREIKNN